MSEPFIYISTHKIKEGKVEDYKRFFSEFQEHVQAEEPQIIAFHGFLNEDGTEVTIVQVHPDAASMDFHLQVIDQVMGEKLSEWVERQEFLEPKHAEIYGTPGAGLLEAVIWFGKAGAALSVKPLHIAGFTRSSGG